MNSPHPDLNAFFDQQLSAEDADAVRTHLADCAQCQRELHALMQLDARVESLEARRPKVWTRVVPLVALAAVALLGVFFASRETPVTPVAPVVQLASARQLDARVSWREGDVWRPYEPSRGVQGSDSVSMTTLAALEASG
ncbi:MAG: anti-sigma factor family protein, partial [Archangium sp.]